jgi:cell division protein FtsW
MVVCGLAMCYSTTFLIHTAVPHQDLLDQIRFLVIGLVLATGSLLIAGRLYGEWPDAWFYLVSFFWFFCLLLTGLVFTGFGVYVNGATRWLRVGSVQFQPSELAKVAMVLYMSTCFARLEKNNSSRLRTVMMVTQSLMLIMSYKQNDVGTAILLYLTLVAVMFLGNRPVFVRGRGFVTSITCMLLVAVLAVAATLILPSFRQSRWLGFFCPLKGDAAITHLSSELTDQLRNGFFALGDGGILGLGAGLSKQKYFYLSEATNDFIFAIIGEEFGIIGAGFVVLLFLLFAFFGLRIAQNAASLHGKMIAGGATTMITAQALVNIGGVVGASPLTGKPLPFFSVGGSSMVGSVLLVSCIVLVALFDSSQAAATRRQDAFVVLSGQPSRKNSSRKIGQPVKRAGQSTGQQFGQLSKTAADRAAALSRLRPSGNRR